jgi:hypothetical protein
VCFKRRKTKTAEIEMEIRGAHARRRKDINVDKGQSMRGKSKRG